MKKTIYLLAFVLLSALTFSCSSDSDGGSTKGDIIVGNWKLTGFMFGDMVEPVENEPCEDEFYKFNGNGKGKITEKSCDEPAYEMNFTWEKTSGDYYYLSNELGEGEVKITFSNNNKTMHMYSSGSEDSAAVFQKQ